jgi:two-component system CheB/CheR fusion protein
VQVPIFSQNCAGLLAARLTSDGSKKKNGLNMQSSSETKTENEFPIVGVGASAGGLDPIRKLLENLPIDTGMAFVVIQHLATGQESMLPEILSRSTKMKVIQVADGMIVEKDSVYVIPPGTILTLKNSYLKLATRGSSFKPINDFMISLASERKTQAIGIVMSGTGNDGTEGLKAIKAEGGIAFAQEPSTAQYPDMPKNAIAAETSDFILSPENIAKELVRIAKHPQLMPFKKQEKVEPEKVESDLKKIIMLLKTTFGVDFTHYKETTINRRITRRMVINKTKNLKEYIDYLRTHPNEPQALFDDLLIGVTSFFREPKTFEVLKEKVFPELIKNRSSGESIRVWVPGCSTGEEVYSLAIAIQEFLEEKVLPEIKVQIFGTDANGKNIDKARQGTYPKIIEENVSESRLRYFFNRQNGNYQITKPIRDMCIFAKQDITNDPPFSNQDLIMCRNVLIYFDPLLHERVFPIFHYGLKSNAFLVLGESESVGKFQYLFEAINPKGVVYRKKQAQPQILIQENFVPQAAKKTVKTLEKINLTTVLEGKVDHLIISEYGPATLLVNNNLDILVFRGDVAPYLSPESGAASFNVTKIVRKELRSQIQTALYRAKKEKKAFKETVRFKQKGQPKAVSIEIRTLEIPMYEEPFYIVLITEVNSNDLHLTHNVSAPLSPGEAETIKDRQIRELGEDLDATKQSLQALVEGQEATNEELRASMEEVQSSNEELQSTNEELETAKEELQSGNEELQTLNEELKNRNQALARLNDDLANLQTNLDIAVVIVDSGLKIRRFTVAAQELLKISPSDVGGSIANITPGVHIEDLGKIITEVIDILTPISREVEGLEGHFYEMRIRPYLTGDKKIDGAFLSFTDITKRKKAEEALNKYSKNLEELVEERTSQLKDSERLAAIGATAGMVGHDIRNPLQAITSDVYLAKTELASTPESEGKKNALDSLQEIEKNIDYINKIVQDLQDYARPLNPKAGEADLKRIIEKMLQKNGIPKNVKVSVNVEDEARKVVADADYLNRILYNLVTNAVQAMPKGGKLTITAHEEANDIVITVADTGVGIPKEIQNKMFTPMFTTKAKGQGFGLPVVKRMTESLSGTVSFESQEDKGTTFTVRLPLQRAKR